MINGLGVLGWGVGGIEAEAAMLGQPISMLLPQVVGFRLGGELSEGATATDLVLTVTEMLRERGVVGKFVEFFGPGLRTLGLADRATIGNMSPEFGSTCAIFPVDSETLRYLEFTGRPTELIELVDAYARQQGLFHAEDSEEPTFSETLELDLGEVEPSIAGPKRPQDRIALAEAKAAFIEALREFSPDAVEELGNHHDQAVAGSFPASDPPGDDHNDERGRPRQATGGAATAERKANPVAVTLEDGTEVELDHGRVVIAAITSCTNTSNPSVMLAAGLLARKAVERGLDVKPWVKTSLAPGSTVVTDYLQRAGLTEYLDKLKFNLVGYGCTTCIGNSGPLPAEISAAVEDNGLVVCAVLSGNRNFEARINPDVRANYLASPPLCVAYALAGRMDIDLLTEPLGEGSDGEPVYLRDLWPGGEEIKRTVESAIRSDMFTKSYADVFTGDDRWSSLEIPAGDRYEWTDSTYVRKPPFFEGIDPEPRPTEPIEGTRVLAVLGDSVTTDHISPAGAIKRDSPAGKWLIDQGTEVRDFNSYGSRRGNHEVMIRGTFANVRLRNRLVEREGGFTRHFPDGEEMTIYEAAMRYAAEGVQLVVLAGKEYGSGSSRDWAAKGTALLGVRAVIAESYERIHRSNLIGMGVLPLEFPDSEGVESLGLTGEETISVERLDEALAAAGRRGAQGGRQGRARRRRSRGVRGPRAARHAQRGRLLPERRHPAARLARSSLSVSPRGSVRGYTGAHAWSTCKIVVFSIDFSRSDASECSSTDESGTLTEQANRVELVPGQSRLRGRSRRHPSLATDAQAWARAVWTPCLPQPRPAMPRTLQSVACLCPRADRLAHVGTDYARSPIGLRPTAGSLFAP